MIQDARVYSVMVEHDRAVPMIEGPLSMIEADRADYSRAKLNHDLIVSIISLEGCCVRQGKCTGGGA